MKHIVRDNFLASQGLAKSHVASRLGTRWVRRHVRHIDGVAVDVRIGPGEAAVGCVVRDSEEYVEAFIEYHLDLGFKHVVLLDNGSEDRTVAIAAQIGARDGRVSVLQTSLPYHTWETPMKQYLAELLGSHGAWVFVADHDEFFYLPGQSASRSSLPGLIAYLDRHDYSAVVTHQVDLFPLAQELNGSYDFDRDEHVFYDLSKVVFASYGAFMAAAECKVVWQSDARINFLLNGVRHDLFAVERPLWLTKHSFIRPALGAWLRHPHLVQEGRVADVTCALLHYPFTSRLGVKVSRAVALGRVSEYLQYLEGLRGVADLRFVGQAVRRLVEGDQLLAEGVITASSRYWRQCARLSGSCDE
jgi:hypothetical protein